MPICISVTTNLHLIDFVNIGSSEALEEIKTFKTKPSKGKGMIILDRRPIITLQ